MFKQSKLKIKISELLILFAKLWTNFISKQFRYAYILEAAMTRWLK